MFILGLFSIFMGYIFHDIFIGVGNDFFSNSIFILYSNSFYFDVLALNPFIKNIPFFFCFMGFFLGYFFHIYFSRIRLNKYYNKFYFFFFDNLYPFFICAFFFNFFYNTFFKKFYFYSYFCFTKILEKGFFELFGAAFLYIL